ncbi:hypothetical protein ACFP1Z_28520 [Streptomyces gamaensis]|uniref:DUF5076 domain-containing protein n=1 Tax=Streptomyces gamaensis TaxID=1763542 RepID=A0ABW0ZAI4_9ACTN
MADETGGRLPFSVRFDAASREVVVMMTFGNPPRQTMRRKAFSSLEAVAVAVAEHHHEAFLQATLAGELASAAIAHLGADPGRLEEAVRALSDPASTVPLGAILHGEKQP